MTKTSLAGFSLYQAQQLSARAGRHEGARSRCALKHAEACSRARCDVPSEGVRHVEWQASAWAAITVGNARGAGKSGRIEVEEGGRSGIEEVIREAGELG